MAGTKKSAGYRIDGRVSIALDALNDKQKQDVGEVITDREHFIARTADSRSVGKNLQRRSILRAAGPVRAANHLLKGRG